MLHEYTNGVCPRWVIPCMARRLKSDNVMSRTLTSKNHRPYAHVSFVYSCRIRGWPRARFQRASLRATARRDRSGGAERSMRSSSSSARRLATQLGVARNTVDQYISVLENYFLVFRLPPAQTQPAQRDQHQAQGLFLGFGSAQRGHQPLLPLRGLRRPRRAVREPDRGRDSQAQPLRSAPLQRLFLAHLPGLRDRPGVGKHAAALPVAVQITTTGRASLSAGFDSYNPA